MIRLSVNTHRTYRFFGGEQQMGRFFAAYIVLVSVLVTGAVFTARGIAPWLPGSSFISYATHDGSVFTFSALSPARGHTVELATDLDFNTYYTTASDATTVLTAASTEGGNALRTFNLFDGTSRDVPYTDFLPTYTTPAPNGDWLFTMGVSGFVRVDGDTGATTPLTDILGDGGVLSPDGDKLAYMGFEGLFLHDMTTGQRTPLAQSVQGLPSYSQARFSPDGKQLTYISDSYVSEDNGLFVIDMATRDTRKLTDDTVEAVDYPTWAPDGRHIAYTGLVMGASNIYVVNVNTGATRPLTDDRTFQQHLAWSK